MRVKVKNLIKYLVKEKYNFLILFVFSFALNELLDTESAIFWTIFLAFGKFEWDNKIVGGAAIFFLALCPLSLSLQLDLLAEQFAIYAYYFLVMTVVLQAIEYWKYPDRFAE